MVDVCASFSAVARVSCFVQGQGSRPLVSSGNRTGVLTAASYQTCRKMGPEELMAMMRQIRKEIETKEVTVWRGTRSTRV